MNHNILITSAGQRVALVRGFQESLKRFFPEAKVFTTDMNPRLAPATYVSDGCFEVLRVTNPNYIQQILKLCKDNEIGMIIPTIDTELLVMAENKKLFDVNNIFVSVSSLDFIRVCRDKRNTGEFFEKHGIRVPKPIDKKHPTFPLFAKPYDGSLSTNLHYIKNAEELTTEILDDPKLLFMEYIDKDVYKEYTVDMYYALKPSADGNVMILNPSTNGCKVSVTQLKVTCPDASVTPTMAAGVLSVSDVPEEPKA